MFGEGEMGTCAMPCIAVIAQAVEGASLRLSVRGTPAPLVAAWTCLTTSPHHAPFLASMITSAPPCRVNSRP